MLSMNMMGHAPRDMHGHPGDMGHGHPGDMGHGHPVDMGHGHPVDMGHGLHGDMGHGLHGDMGHGLHGDMGHGLHGDMGQGPPGEMPYDQEEDAPGEYPPGEDDEVPLPRALEQALAYKSERAREVGIELDDENDFPTTHHGKFEEAIPSVPPAPVISQLVDEDEEETEEKPKKEKGQKKKKKKKKRRKHHTFNKENTDAKKVAPKEEKQVEKVEIDYIQEKLEISRFDPVYGQFLKILDAFKLEEPEQKKEEDEKAAAERKAEEERRRAEELRKVPKNLEEEPEEDSKEQEPGKTKLSKRQLKKLTRLSIAELKQLVPRPDVVEMHDVTAHDPKLLVHLKTARNTVPVPRHWCFKRKYLQGKRGFEKPPFQLPDFIRKTGIQEMRQALADKEEQKSLKAKMRERVRPKLGKIDIDYQKLHDAFFKWQTKPKMTIHGDLYYEGKEFETRLKEKKPGELSDELRIALGMPLGTAGNKVPPPWLIAMQRYGPPPSYPNLRIPGLNAPIPDGCSFGYHAGGWGKPPVDEMGRPLYGDVFGSTYSEQQEAEVEEEEVDRSLWGEMESESESESEEEEEEEEAGEKVGEPGEAQQIEEGGLVTPGLVTPSGMASIPSLPAGMETPELIELRKKKIETEMEGGETPALYQVLQEKPSEGIRGAMMGSTHTYEMNIGVAPVGAGSSIEGGVDVTLDPAELDLVGTEAMRAKYEQTLRQQQAARELGLGKEDLSDMVAQHAAKQKNKRKRQQEKQETAKQAKKYRDVSDSPLGTVQLGNPEPREESQKTSDLLATVSGECYESQGSCCWKISESLEAALANLPNEILTNTETTREASNLVPPGTSQVKHSNKESMSPYFSAKTSRDISESGAVYIDNASGFSSYIRPPLLNEVNASQQLPQMNPSVNEKLKKFRRILGNESFMPFIPQSPSKRLNLPKGAQGERKKASNNLKVIEKMKKSMKEMGLFAVTPAEVTLGTQWGVYDYQVPCTLNRHLFNTIQVLGQVDQKLIVVKGIVEDGEEWMLFVDQHAAHERVRLEKLTQSACKLDKKGEPEVLSLGIHPPVQVDLLQEEVHILDLYRCTDDSKSDRGSFILLELAGAIKFNESLTKVECKELLRQLSGESGSANLEYLCKRFGHAEVPVAECHERDTYDSLQVHKWTFSKYLEYLEGDERRKLFYLKDWHFFQDFPLEPVYETPVYFSSDWLNEYWQECQGSKDDYRFVYFGPKGSWTPWHADVLRWAKWGWGWDLNPSAPPPPFSVVCLCLSHSWSTNVFGQKRWLLLPPGSEVPYIDSHGNMRDSPVGPEVIQVIQNPGETLWVPSGWFHRVENLEDTLSINHNFINATNAHHVLEFLLKRLQDVREEISDCSDMDQWDSQCQLLLKSVESMDLKDYGDFLSWIAKRRMEVLQDKVLCSIHGRVIGRNHAMFDLHRIHSIFSRMAITPDTREVLDQTLLQNIHHHISTS
ncbi:unnamed protein product [Darwinula stevensoni]|uniref:JmjC domain-containing protein n=1 Tax=Darwinula stevensoni TaxID=69355 RepID=A0A7R9A276_9CRUS|nr:unnamed protein product [Darwinula stevensoni]CAG0888147.1 unnamed protein product [Darwinula stevensoni]